MAFPVIRTNNEDENSVDTTTPNLSMTSIVQSGDRALAFRAIDADGANPFPAGFATGWNQVVGVFSGSARHMSVWEKINCDGTETDFTFSLDNAQKTYIRTYFITGSSGNAAEASAINNGTTNDPDTLSLTPSWGIDDTLWFSFYVAGNQDSEATGYPANYTLAQHTNSITTNDSTQSAYGVGARQLNAVSEDPGNFSRDGTASWNGVTIAVEPGDLLKYLASRLASSKRVLTPDPPLLLSDRKA